VTGALAAGAIAIVISAIGNEDDASDPAASSGVPPAIGVRSEAMENHSPQERLASAVECLAVSAASIQRRLVNAGIALSPLLPSDFSDPDREQFAAIMAALTAVEPDDLEGRSRRPPPSSATEKPRRSPGRSWLSTVSIARSDDQCRQGTERSTNPPWPRPLA
jgi:hypothetical protein